MQSFERMGYAAQYNDEYFDSQTEAAWAVYFDAAGMPYVREPETFEFPSGEIYTPDFFLPDQDTFVEVKNQNIDYDTAHKLARLAELTGRAALLLDGKPHNVGIFGYSPNASLNTSHHSQTYRIDSAYYMNKYKLVLSNGLDPILEKTILACMAKAESSWTINVDPEVVNASKARKRQLFLSRTVLKQP